MSAVLSFTHKRLHRRIDQYRSTGNLTAAQTALESLIQLLPDDIQANFDLAQVLLERGHLKASEKYLQKIINCAPNDPKVYFELVKRLYRTGNILAARQCLETSEGFGNLPGEMVAAQAHLRWMLGEITPAKSKIEHALSLGVDTPDEHYLHASLLQFVGLLGEAVDVLENCIERWPAFGGAAMALGKLKRQTAENNHLNYLNHVLQRIPEYGTVPGDRLIRAEFEAALFKELDDLERYDEARKPLFSFNHLMHELNPYEPNDEEALVDALISESARDKLGRAVPRKNTVGPIPIFIVGMPRSGSTLLDRMLSCHSEVASAGEINDVLKQVHWLADVPMDGAASTVRAIQKLSKADLGGLGARYLEQTQWRAQGCRYYIDKLPANIQWVSIIRRALPNSIIVHVTREPMDLCFSNFKAMFGNTSAYSYDLRSIGHYYLQYQRLVNHWHAAFPGAILDVNYESLVVDPVAAITNVLSHCKLEFQEKCVHPELNGAPVATPSSGQVREAIHKRALGQWMHYQSDLQPLRGALASAIQ